MKRILLVVLLLISSPLFAQRGGTIIPRTSSYTLTLNTNVSNATLFIDNRRLDQRSYTVRNNTQYSMTLDGSSFTLRIEAEGYQPFEEDVNLSRNLTLTANLQPISYVLSVNSNVTGATVKVNGSTVGQTPGRFTYGGGTYTVSVEAPGYQSYSTRVNLSGNQTVTASLQLITYTLSISSNVTGATVTVGKDVVGQTPVQVALQPGNYGVTVTAPNYQDYSATVNVNRNTTLNATLQPAFGTLQIDLPRGANVVVYVDGARQQSSSISLLPGQHTVRLDIGGFTVETTVTIQSGQTTVVSPSVGIDVE